MITDPKGDKFVSNWESDASLKTGHVSLPHGLTLGKLKQTIHFIGYSVFFPFQLMERHALTYPQVADVIRALEAMQIIVVADHPVTEEGLNHRDWRVSKELMVKHPESFTPLRFTKKGITVGMDGNSTPKPLTAKRLDDLLDSIKESARDAGLIQCLGNMALCSSQDIYRADTFDIYIACNTEGDTSLSEDLPKAYWLIKAEFDKLRECLPDSLTNVMPTDYLGAVHCVRLDSSPSSNDDSNWSISEGMVNAKTSKSWLDLYHTNDRHSDLYDLVNSVVHLEGTEHSSEFVRRFPACTLKPVPLEDITYPEDHFFDLFRGYQREGNMTVMATCNELVTGAAKPISHEEQHNILYESYCRYTSGVLRSLEAMGSASKYGPLNTISNAWMYYCDQVAQYRNTKKPKKKVPDPVFYTVVHMCQAKPQLGAIVRCTPSQNKPLRDAIQSLAGGYRDVVDSGFRNAGAERVPSSYDLIFYRLSTPSEVALFGELVTNNRHTRILFTPTKAFARSGGYRTERVEIEMDQPDLELVEQSNNLLRHYYTDTGFDEEDLSKWPEYLSDGLKSFCINKARNFYYFSPDRVNFFDFDLSRFLRSSEGNEWQCEDSNADLIRLSHVGSRFGLEFRQSGVTGVFNGEKVFELTEPRNCHFLILSSVQRIINFERIDPTLDFDIVNKYFGEQCGFSGDADYDEEEFIRRNER